MCGLAFVAFLQALRGAGQATLHSGQSGQVLVLSALALILALGVLLALPNFVKARANSSKNACVANLKQIQGAKETWATENHKTLTAAPRKSDLFGRDRYIRTTPICPMNGIYHLGAVNEDPICSWGGPGHSLESDPIPSPR